MSSTHVPYQRSQSGIQRRVPGKKGTLCTQPSCLQSDGRLLTSGYETQSPGPRLGLTQSDILESVLRYLTGNSYLKIDRKSRRLYVIASVSSTSLDTSVRLFIRQPVLYTATLHVSACPAQYVDRAISQLLKATGSSGTCLVNKQGRDLCTLMGKYACNVYDLILEQCNTCTARKSMVSTGDSAICAYVRIGSVTRLCTLSLDCVRMIANQTPDVLHHELVLSSTGARMEVQARNTEMKGTKITIDQNGYLKCLGRMDLLIETLRSFNSALTLLLHSEKLPKFLNMLTLHSQL
jgi:hypothetical protein